MSISTTLSKVEVQKMLYEAGAKVPPMPVFGPDEDGIDEYSTEGEKDADTLVGMDIYVAGRDFYVAKREDGEWSTAYDGDDFQKALEAYREAAVETTLQL